MADYIKQLIAEGEHQRLEFKFEVSDFRKIARTLVVFANTGGGSLLIGVKDNGAIAGIRSEEEYFMVEGAARIYCKPEIYFNVREWQVDGKKVLEVIIKEGIQKPYFAQDTNGDWIAFIRQGDENFKAHGVMLKVWKRTREGLGTTIKFRRPEKTLLEYLELNQFITISRFRRIAGLTSEEAEAILVSFQMLDLIKLEYSGTSVNLRLTTDYRKIVEKLTDWEQAHS
jgi:predicted HTH transcriptional regulator